jgi:hypothetical protein
LGSVRVKHSFFSRAVPLLRGRSVHVASVEEITVRSASTAIQLVCVTALLALVQGCSSFGGGSSGAPSKQDQALASAQNALQEAKAARAAADAALQEARANRAKMDEVLSTVRAATASPDAAQQALEQARAANQAAQEAKAMAQQAQDASQRSSARADRMFQKAMRK